MNPFASWKLALVVAACALAAGCGRHVTREVVDIGDPAGLAELKRVIEAVQTAVVETQDSFPVQPHAQLAQTILAQCKSAKAAAKSECDALVAGANAQCEGMTGNAVEARCGAALAVADRRCIGVEKRLDVATLCGKLDALAGVSIRKATLRLETVRAQESGGGFKFFVVNIGGGKTARNAQRLELAFTPVPTADPTEIRAQALSGNVGQLQSYIASRKTASDLRSQQLSSTQESGGLKDAARLIEFIRSAAQAASIERIGDKEAPLLTNTFTVAFAFEVTKKSEFGLEWELTPYKVGFNAGSSRNVGNELVLEFGQPE